MMSRGIGTDRLCTKNISNLHLYTRTRTMAKFNSVLIL